MESNIANISYQGGISVNLSVVGLVNDGLKGHTKFKNGHVFPVRFHYAAD